MENKDFKLRPTDEFIELVKLLKLEMITQTGGHAKMIIEEGNVYVNGEQESRKRRKLRTGDVVIYEGNTIVIVD